MSSSAFSLHFLSPVPNFLSISSKSTAVLSSHSFSYLRSPPKSLLSISSPFLHFSAFPSRLVALNAAFSSEFKQEEQAALREEEVPNFSRDLEVFVGNLSPNVDSAALAEVFQRAGIVEMVKVIYDQTTGRSRGFGFVTMSTVDDAEAAARQFDGYELDGRELRVNHGPPPQKSESSFRGSRGGGGGGSFDNTNKVYVNNLAWDVDGLALETLFSKQGQVMKANVIYDRESGRSRGFGFVTYNSADECNNAIESLDGAELNGKSIRVSMAESRPRRQF